MLQDLEPTLRQTVLHDWHAANGAKMVDFGGWDMPVQYKSGTIREHLATRRHAGLFDVTHMGRYEFRGSGAEAYLCSVLTNNARALAPHHAHYTFIANEAGGAIDDAYLYRLAEDRFLLVVNAANRDKDWQWLEQHRGRHDVEMRDVSDELGMISLQGPHASMLLEQIVGKAQLPENKRNWLGVATADGGEVIIARTGYTGEAVGFELFPETGRTVALWERLVDLGAVPVGLGARDSLRLEAGLPLYGHELGEDPEGREIPIFANPMAAFAVRVGGTGDYMGKAALERQRAEYTQIKRGELDTPVEERALTHLVQPVAVFAGRRPLRAGFKVTHDGAGGRHRHLGHQRALLALLRRGPDRGALGRARPAAHRPGADPLGPALPHGPAHRPPGVGRARQGERGRAGREELVAGVALHQALYRVPGARAKEAVELRQGPRAGREPAAGGRAQHQMAARGLHQPDPLRADRLALRRRALRFGSGQPLQRAQPPEVPGPGRPRRALLQGHRLHHGEGGGAQGRPAQLLRLPPG